MLMLHWTPTLHSMLMLHWTQTLHNMLILHWTPTLHNTLILHCTPALHTTLMLHWTPTLQYTATMHPSFTQHPTITYFLNIRQRAINTDSTQHPIITNLLIKLKPKHHSTITHSITQYHIIHCLLSENNTTSLHTDRKLKYYYTTLALHANFEYYLYLL